MKLFNTQESDIIKQLYDEATEYIKSRFDELLIKKDENTYNFNDNIGVRIIGFQQDFSPSQIRIETVYYINKKITTIGTHIWRWSYHMKNTIDDLINQIIKELPEIQEKRDKAALSRVAKKYNL